MKGRNTLALLVVDTVSRFSSFGAVSLAQVFGIDFPFLFRLKWEAEESFSLRSITNGQRSIIFTKRRYRGQQLTAE